MRRKNREINIFSVSFLDLLSGALAAVIILFIIVPKMDSTAREALDALEELDLRAENLEQMVNQLERSVDRAIVEEIRAEMRAMRSALESAREAVQELQARNEQLQNENDQLRSQISELENQIANLEQRLSDALEDARQARLAAQSMQETIIRLSPKHLDLFILLDITSSMGDALNGLKSEISNVIEIIEHIAPSAGIGVIAYGDMGFNNPITVFELRNISSPTNKRALVDFINSLQLEIGRGSGSNQQIPEALHLAMERALRTQWRGQSEEQRLVIFTDAPCYENQVNNVLNMARTFKSGGNNRYISTVQVYDRRVYDETKAILTQLADIGEGNYVDLRTGGSFLTSLIISLIDGV